MKVIRIEGIKTVKTYEGSYLPVNRAILNNTKLFGVTCNKAGTTYKAELHLPKEYVSRPEFADVYISTLEGAEPVQVAEYVDKLYACYDSPKVHEYFGLDRETFHRKVFSVLNNIVHQLSELNKDKVYGSCAYQEAQAEAAMLKACYAQDQALKGQVYNLAKDLSKDEHFCQTYNIRVGVPTAVLYRFGINLIEDCVPVTTGEPCYVEALDNAAHYGISGLEEYSLKDPAVYTTHTKQVYGKESRRFVCMEEAADIDHNPYNIYTSLLQQAAAKFNFSTSEFDSEIDVDNLTFIKEILIKAGSSDVDALNKAKKALFSHYKDMKSVYTDPYDIYSRTKYSAYDYKKAKVDGNHAFVEAMVKTSVEVPLTVLACKFVNLQAAYYKLYDLKLTNEFGEELGSMYDFRSAPTSREDLEDYMKEYDNPSYTADQLQYWRAHWDK